ncbi:unnamed protein product [Lampetra planeri]
MRASQRRTGLGRQPYFATQDSVAITERTRGNFPPRVIRASRYEDLRRGAIVEKVSPRRGGTETRPPERASRPLDSFLHRQDPLPEKHLAATATAAAAAAAAARGGDDGVDCTPMPCLALTVFARSFVQALDRLSLSRYDESVQVPDDGCGVLELTPPPPSRNDCAGGVYKTVTYILGKRRD